jgi:hypothetical protein
MIPEARFFLKSLKSIVPTLIYIDIKYSIDDGSERFTLTTGEKIRPKNWDFKK